MLLQPGRRREARHRAADSGQYLRPPGAMMPLHAISHYAVTVDAVGAVEIDHVDRLAVVVVADLDAATQDRERRRVVRCRAIHPGGISRLAHPRQSLGAAFGFAVGHLARSG